MYRGARLASTLDWVAGHERDLNQLERDSLAESRAEAEHEAEHQRRTNRRLRGLLAGLAALLALAVVAGVVALRDRSSRPVTSLFTTSRARPSAAPAPAAGARFARVLAGATTRDHGLIGLNLVMRERERQRSREFGIKLAKALRERAVEAWREHDLDPRYVMLGAGEYLREAADFQLNPPIDDTRVDPGERSN